MKTLFIIITLLSIVWVVSTEDNEPHKVTVVVHEKEVFINENTTNFGDLVIGEKQDRDILLYREVFINNINETNDQYFVLKTKSNKYKFSNIRFLNIGRQHGNQYNYKFEDDSKLEIDFTVNKNEQAYVWIELYGNRTSAILSSGILLILTNIIYILIN